MLAIGALFPVQLVEKMSPATSKLHCACCWRWKASNAGHDKGSGSSADKSKDPSEASPGSCTHVYRTGALGGGGLKAPGIC
jgi:hypothetical protein